MAIEEKLDPSCKHNDIIEMLARAGVRPSPVRTLIIKELLEADRPLSAMELEERLDTVDRSSITRSLTIFAEERLVHIISDGSGSMKYELCKSCTHDSGHSDEHVHFHCRVCGQTVCLQNAPIQVPTLPQGYEPEFTTFVITGLCPKCR